MAIFNVFKKKKEEIKFPSESVIPAFPKPPEALPPRPQPPQPQPTPPFPGREFPSPEPLQQPEQKPAVPMAPLPEKIPPLPPLPEIKLPELPEIGIERRAKPSIYIKVSKYRELLASLEKLRTSLRDLKKALEEYEYARAQEDEKLAACSENLRRIEDILKFFDQVFTQPEE
ncbi:MAG: hypothetical protein QW507_02650 [Candidatus Nanoarchaeia archaeon]|nr:hypothetical protein [Candidatus Haiyanarchaeum thermophilum]MCW1303339.1 hypothetical protein [Candidatus Haiyanarchaeum thermophilum]MCW1304079.1 hypothetical protein [Candidatus Haiyanarchaeum thermophilum]MCW1306499.1 hypothetical protein [Candidatus Haiyanarchaeum thermophilum]MCW1307549.1 hypothetical protein [Candidatus Haiyanarchaeum thermophilum]